jgi:hypothetical protein
MVVISMKRDLLKKYRAVLALTCIMLLATIVPVSAGTEMHVVLDKTYEFRLANVSTIDSIDIGNLSLSQVEVRSTEAGDLQTIHTPVIRRMTRDFTTTTGTFEGVEVTITGDNPSTVDLTAMPDFRIYTQPSVPTIDISAPGHSGNPIISKYNESWNKADTHSLSSLFRSSDGGYIYKTAGAAYVNPDTGNYLTSGTWDISEPNLTYTLDVNKVADLGSFTGDSTASFNLGDLNPVAKAGPGKYYAGAILHNEEAKNISVYAMYPVVIINGTTPLRWTNSTGSYTTGTLNNTYIQDITLDFSGTNPDLSKIHKVTYLILNDTVQYDMTVNINTSKLAENAQSRWQTSFSPGTQVIDLLYEGIQNDVGTPFNYTMTAVGYSTPAPSTEWSVIAVTPGFGISGSTTGTSITVPAQSINQLNKGLYDVYLMGTDVDNNIVALDQKQVWVAGTVGTRIGAVRNTHSWILDVNGNGKFNVNDYQYSFGKAGDVNVTGDWNGDRKTEIGVVRNNMTWLLDASGDGRWSAGDLMYTFGKAGDKFVSGDWNGNGTTKIGIVRNGNTWILDANGDGRWSTGDLIYTFGTTGDTYLSGDWNGNGTTKIGVFRNGNTWVLDANGNGKYGPGDLYYTFGKAGDMPVTGDWSGNRVTKIGVVRNERSWVLDASGSGSFGAGDLQHYYGKAGDGFVTGNW